MRILVIVNFMKCVVTDYLEEVEQDSEDGQTLLDLIQSSYLQQDFLSPWKSVRVQLVKNKHLDSEFDGKIPIV